jgi:LuxR family transcriptional activator of conjugal transfer of Ti plasmids
MKSIERSFQEFIDAMQTADGKIGFERIAKRITEHLGFRWFAYLRLTDDKPTLISSYPKSWTDRYVKLGYQQIDPVVQRARRESALFSWSGSAPRVVGTQEQRRLFDEAMTFGINSGVTVPIRGGFGRMAAFTMASDKASAPIELLASDSRGFLPLVGLYFHTYVTVRVPREANPTEYEGILTQRERQCLAWVARGKTVADIAILVGIAPRTVVFHLERARKKLNASSVAHCVAEAMRRGLLP